MYVLSMTDSKTIQSNFIADLKAVFAKYGAEISADDHWQGYAECGQDVRITVSIPAVYEKNYSAVISEGAEIDLGRHFDGK